MTLFEIGQSVDLSTVFLVFSSKDTSLPCIFLHLQHKESLLPQIESVPPY